MKKPSVIILSFALAAALAAVLPFTANEYSLSFVAPVEAGAVTGAQVVQSVAAAAGVPGKAGTAQVNLDNAGQIAPETAADRPAGESKLSAQSPNTAPELPYDVATDEDLWAQWNAIWRLKLSGVKITSQTPEVKDFMRSANVRMCDDPKYNFNFDYDYINDIIYDDDGGGLAKIGYDYDARQGIFFSAMNPWNRQVGYCLAYDAIGPLFQTNLDTKRFKFSFGGYDWMIQVWKGQYGAYSTGAEIGTYYREPDTVYFPPSLYLCVPDEMMLEVEMDLYYKDEFLFNRPLQKNWWLTGFVVFQSCEPEDVRVDAKIVFPGEEMRDAFITALEGYGYIAGETYTVTGCCVAFSY